MLSVVSLLALSACSNDDSDTLTRVPLTIKATIQGAETRVTDNGDGSGSFEEGDVIHLSQEIEASDYDIGLYEYDGNKFVPKGNDFYLDPKSTSDITIWAYYDTGDITNEGKYQYNGDKTTIDQTNGLLAERLSTYATCNARNPEILLEFHHYMAKVTLKFSADVSECKLIVNTNKTYLCKITTTEDGTKAEARMELESLEDGYFGIECTVGTKIYTGKINLAELKANHHYIYNIKISDVLTVSENTSITGFEDTGTTFEAIQQ
jgi:hypothetical protein